MTLFAEYCWLILYGTLSGQTENLFIKPTVTVKHCFANKNKASP